jgi:large subunit ribosomal protein L18e
LLDRDGALKSLKKTKRPVFLSALKTLQGSRKRFARVNVEKLSRVAKEGSMVLVPGKVLGAGKLDKKLFVGAFDFSEEARRKIMESGGEALSIDEFISRFSDKGGILLVR